MAQTEQETEYNLRINDIAEFFPFFTKKHIQNLARDGKIPHRRWGEGEKAPYLFNREEVLEWKRRMTINPDKTKTSFKGAKSGTSVRKGKGETLRSRSKQLIRQSLASASNK